MEALAGVSSVLAVVSVAFQLAEGIHSLVKFCKAVQDAPAGLIDLIADLESLSEVLLQSQPIDELAGVDHFTADALKSCEHTISKLQKKIFKRSKELRSRGRLQKLRAGFKFVLQEHEITSLRLDIDRAKTSLLLAKANSLLYITNSHHQSQKQYLFSVSQDIKQATKRGLETAVERIKLAQAMQLDGPSNPNSLDVKEAAPAQVDLVAVSHTDFKAPNSTKIHTKQQLLFVSKQDLPSPLWSLRRRARSKYVTKIDSSGSRSTRQEDIDYVLYPSGLLRRLGLASGICIQARSTSGWQYTIHSFNAVKETSPIFEFCRDGNIAAVQKLLQLGEASVRDRDPLGRTPLWIAAQSLQPEIAELLLREGADPHVYDWRNKCSPIGAIGGSSNSDIAKEVSMISLFESYGFDGHEDMDILSLIGRLMLAYRPLKIMAMDIAERRHAAFLLLKHLTRFLPKDDSYQTMILFFIMGIFHDQDVLRWTLANIEGPILEDSESSSIHRAIGMKLLTRDPVSVEMIVRKTSDLHRFWTHSWIPPSTPTSLVMFQPEMFYAWVRLLRDLSHDLRDFVRSELLSTASPLSAEGWDQESLLALFNSEPVPNSVNTPTGFFACQRCGHPEGYSWPKIDLLWRRQLRSIRHRENNQQSNEHHMNIALLFNKTKLIEPEPSADAYPILMEHPAKVPETLPYSIVCSGECRDGVCVAWVFEDVSVGEPFLPAYPYKKEPESGLLSEQAVDIDWDECPSKKMPGAFQD